MESLNNEQEMKVEFEEVQDQISNSGDFYVGDNNIDINDNQDFNMTQFPDLQMTQQFIPLQNSKGLANIFDVRRRMNHKINLRKVKSKIMKCVEDDKSKRNHDENSQEGNLKFSDIFKQLKLSMPESTVETAFIWTLHYINQNNIEIMQNDDIDFDIQNK